MLFIWKNFFYEIFIPQLCTSDAYEKKKRSFFIYLWIVPDAEQQLIGWLMSLSGLFSCSLLFPSVPAVAPIAAVDTLNSNGNDDIHDDEDDSSEDWNSLEIVSKS